MIDLGLRPSGPLEGEFIAMAEAPPEGHCFERDGRTWVVAWVARRRLDWLVYVAPL